MTYLIQVFSNLHSDGAFMIHTRPDDIHHRVDFLNKPSRQINMALREAKYRIDMERCRCVVGEHKQAERQTSFLEPFCGRISPKVNKILKNDFLFR